MDFTTRQNPFMQEVVDLLLHVGKDNYSVGEFIREAEQWGISRKIPAQSIPKGYTPGVTRLFVWHDEVLPRVTAEGKTMKDLTARLVELNLISQAAATSAELFEEWHPEELLLPNDFVPGSILTVTMAVQDCAPALRKAITEEFGIKWQGGVFGYAPSGKVQYVTKDENGEVPEELQYLGDAVEAVYVTYVNDNGEELDLESNQSGSDNQEEE